MSEFLAIQRYDVPADLPYIVQATRSEELKNYEAWCYAFLGKKADEKPHAATWYQARGYFFFANRTIREQFMRHAAVDARRRLQLATGDHTSNRPNGARVLMEKLYNEFPAAE